MKKLLGAVIGGSIGFITPLVLAVGNETLFIKKQLDNGSQIWDVVQICAFERRWFPLYPKVIHAPGCQNKTLGILPGLLLLSTPAGLAIGAILSKDKRSSRRTADVISRDSSQIEESVAVSIPEQTPIPLQRVQQDALKPQEPVASKPPLVEPLIKKIPKEFDLNLILRMSAIGGALALGGFVAIKVLQNSLDPASTGGEGVGSSSGFNPFRQRTQQQYYLLESYSDAYFKNSYGRNPVNSTLEEKMTREQVCTSAKENVITQSGLGDILANGGKVISQGSQIKIIVKSPYDYVLLGRSRILVDCFYTPYIIER